MEPPSMECDFDVEFDTSLVGQFFFFERDGCGAQLGFTSRRTNDSGRQILTRNRTTTTS